MENEPMLELYHDHYKDTCGLSRASQTRHNRNFVFGREGEHCSKDCPVALNLIHLFYNAACSVPFMGVNVFDLSDAVLDASLNASNQ